MSENKSDGYGTNYDRIFESESKDVIELPLEIQEKVNEIKEMMDKIEYEIQTSTLSEQLNEAIKNHNAQK